MRTCAFAWPCTGPLMLACGQTEAGKVRRRKSVAKLHFGKRHFGGIAWVSFRERDEHGDAPPQAGCAPYKGGWEPRNNLTEGVSFCSYALRRAQQIFGGRLCQRLHPHLRPMPPG